MTKFNRDKIEDVGVEETENKLVVKPEVKQQERQKVENVNKGQRKKDTLV